jgi:hypothetical protein
VRLGWLYFLTIHCQNKKRLLRRADVLNNLFVSLGTT